MRHLIQKKSVMIVLAMAVVALILAASLPAEEVTATELAIPHTTSEMQQPVETESPAMDFAIPNC